MTSPSTGTGRQWLKITFACPAVLLEAAGDLLAVLSGSGVEQSPPTAEGAAVSGFFELRDEGDAHPPERAEAVVGLVEARMAELFALYRQEPVRATHTLLADEDWATSWQQYFKPFAIVPGLVIKPSWEAYAPAAGERVIEMDPGMAFGTGQHASTRMALGLITARLEQGARARALDVGTGTGILAMAAALFGCTEVLAVDNDPDAVAVARQNVAHNHLGARIELAATPVAEIRGSFQLVAANIVHDVLVDLAPDLTRLTAPGGSLVLAGILNGGQEAHIVQVYAALGCRVHARRSQDEWVALELLRA